MRTYLAESSLLRYSVFMLLYVAQGVPLGLLGYAMTAYMADQGLTGAQVASYLSLTMLPWSLKFIYGALMDRWTLPAMGRRRPWVILSQIGMIVTLIATAILPDPLRQFTLFTALSFAMNCWAAMQDVAIDGMAIDLLPVEQQPRANAFMWGGMMLGTSGATAGGAWFLEAFGVKAALFAQALFMVLIVLIPLFIRERRGERLLPWTQGRAASRDQSLAEGWRDIGESLLRALLLPGSVLASLTILSYNITCGVLDALLPLMTVQEMGWEHTDYSHLTATARMVGGILGIVLGGYVVERLGRRRTIAICAGMLALLAVAVGVLASHKVEPIAMKGFVGAYLILDAFAMVAFLSSFMALSWKRVAATQFSIYMGVSNLAFSIGAAVFGFAQGLVPLGSTFFVAGGFALVAVALVRMVDFIAHSDRLRSLDTS